MSLSKPSNNSRIVYSEDIMSLIFMKLPVKSVLKCKCVCKIWQSIASNPHFCHQHAALHGLNPSPSAFIFKYSLNDNSNSNFEFFSLTTNSSDRNPSTSKIVSFDYLNVPGNEILSLLSSCNGLLLFQSDDYNLIEYYVCNPTTKKSFKVALPNYLTAGNLVDASLAFDPCVSPYYKVVFLWEGSDHLNRITMYSSETKSCGKVSFPSYSNYVKLPQGSGVYCNGKIHWPLNYMSETSFYFDVEEGCVKTFPLPPRTFQLPPESFFLSFHSFGASRGRLHAVMCTNITDHTFVFELEEDYSGWFVKYQLKFESYCYLFLCYFCEEEDEGSTLLLLDHSGKVAVNNLKEKTTNKICHLNPLFTGHDLCSVYYPVYHGDQWCPVAYQWIETLSCI